jgi:uncharacterized protein YggL (DUF469 family)
MTDDFLFQIMKKRLRKKLALGEFQKTGFAVGLYLAFATDDTACSHPFWRKITLFVESNGLYVEGTIDDFWVFTNYNKSPIPSIRESDQSLVRNWLQQQIEVISFRIGQPTTDWHPFFH